VNYLPSFTRRPALPGRDAGTLGPAAAVVLAVIAVVTVGAALLTRGTPPEPAVNVPSSMPSPDAARYARHQGNAIDYQGHAYGLRRFAATSDKSQTKLWYTNGVWWAVMSRPGGGSGIFRLAPDSRLWQDTGVIVDPRDRTYADVVYRSDAVSIATRTSTGTIAITRFLQSNNPDTPWTLAPGFPLAIARSGASSLSIDIDTRGRIWAAYNQGARIWVTASDETGLRWSAPAPVTQPNAVHEDDTAALVSGNGQMNLMYSDQVVGAFWWGVHHDDDPGSRIVINRKPAASGIRTADGHIRLLAARSGRIYAAVKTSLGDVRTDPPNSPLLAVLYRDPGDNAWSRSVAAVTANQMTRPQIALNEDESRLYFFATHDQSGGRIYYKIADTDRMTFGAGPGTLLLAWPGAVINNATVGRQRISHATRLVVLASDSSQARYYYAVLPIEK
jgi:hypothetical protein